MRLFKKDLQVPVEAIIKDEVPAMIETAITKSQIAIIDMMMGNVNATDLSYLKCIRKGLVRNLDHIATTEMTPDDTQAPGEIWGDKAPVVGKSKYLVVANLDYISQDYKGELKKMGYTLIEPNSTLFHQLIKEGVLSEDWKP